MGLIVPLGPLAHEFSSKRNLKGKQVETVECQEKQCSSQNLKTNRDKEYHLILLHVVKQKQCLKYFF